MISIQQEDYAEELIRISKLGITFAKNRLVYLVYIPLLTTKSLTIYKLVPSPTNIAKNKFDLVLGKD